MLYGSCLRLRAESPFKLVFSSAKGLADWRFTREQKRKVKKNVKKMLFFHFWV